MRQRVGAAILAGAIGVAGGPAIWDLIEDDPADDLTVVRGLGGQLKENFLTDAAVKKILSDQYRLNVEISVVGSIEMLCDLPLDDKDFIWAGDQSSLSIYRNCGGTSVASPFNVYNSPIVLYSWADIVDALVAEEVAQVDESGAYSVDFLRLAEMILQDMTWSGIGLDTMHGKVTVHTTDPSRSNSGYLFAGLLANALNGGDVVNATTVQPLLEDIARIFDRLGYMEGTSGDLFDQFLTTGMGAKPIAAGYESQLLEFLRENQHSPQTLQRVREQVRILYPEPTVWASHPMVARTASGATLIQALRNPEIQRLAWSEHGQRSGDASISNDVSIWDFPGLLPDITSVVDMPAADVMAIILDAIEPPEATS